MLDPARSERRGEIVDTSTDLKALLRTIVDPYVDADSGQRIELNGPEVAVGAKALTGLALLLHEFTTNAAKYGALASTKGRLSRGLDHGRGRASPDLARGWRRAARRGAGERRVRAAC